MILLVRDSCRPPLLFFRARRVVGRAKPALLIARRKWPRQSTRATRMGHAVKRGSAFAARGNPRSFAGPDARALQGVEARADDQGNAAPGGDRGPVAEPDEADAHHPQRLHIDEG